jgi:hypothetical protein
VAEEHYFGDWLRAFSDPMDEAGCIYLRLLGRFTVAQDATFL